MSARENLRHPWWITALSIARTAVPMSPAPAVAQPLANQVSVSHPVDMHAHAIISAPMANTKNEPIANLRIQGILSSSSRSGLAAFNSVYRNYIENKAGVVSADDSISRQPRQV